MKSGLVANTREPVPVSSEHAVRMLALENVPSIVATFEPIPLTPVEMGKPVQLVNSQPLVGCRGLVISMWGRRRILESFIKTCS